MLSIFKLTEAMSEAASGAAVNVEPFQFAGSLEESVATANYMIAEAVTDMAVFSDSTEEVMTEAAINNAAALSTISESVFDTIRTKVTTMINKLKAWVKGLWEKLKAWFFKFTGKTDKWLKIMEPKISASNAKGGNEKQMYESHKWDNAYIESGLINGVTAFAKDFTAVDTDKNYVAITKITGKYEEILGNTGKMSDEEAAAARAAVAEMEKSSEYVDSTDLTAKTEAAIKYFAEKVGVADATTDINSCYAAIVKKLNGGEKVSQTIAQLGGTDAMIKAIKANGDTVKKMNKLYEDILNTLGKVEGKFKEAFTKMGKFEKDTNSTLASALTNMLSKVSTTTLSILSNEIAYITKAQALNKTALENRTSEYVSVLNKYAGFKEVKE